ncbi:MAG TPA: NUDIX hydrolase [Thermoanaerobaculia bacterium]
MDAAPPPAERRKPGARAARARRMKTEHHRSAGGLVVHSARILLIATQKGRRWQLPKGHIEEGETPEQAAIREVREETGVTGRVVAPLPGVEYWFVERGPCRVHKKVDYFLLDYVGGHSMNFDPEEVSGTGWFSWEAGIARLTFENERKVVRRAKELSDEISEQPDQVAVSTEQAAEG